MYCIYCEKQISDDSVFCCYCGLKQELPQKSVGEEIKTKNVKRSSDNEFDFIDDNMYLKYVYYDVEVKGTQYNEFDISKIELNKNLKFEFEPTNEYDKNAIKVLYDNIQIGYVPKNSIQDMVKKYMTDEQKYVEAFINEVDEDSKYIQMAIAFYQEMTDEELNKIEHIDTRLIKTTKKDEFDIFSRQDNLIGISEGEELELNYEYDSETYIVCDNCGNELGEINSNKSEKLQEYELEGKIFHCIVLETDCNDAGNITCKVRIFIK